MIIYRPLFQKPTSSYELVGFLINAPTFLGRFLGQIGYLGSRLASYPFLQRGLLGLCLQRRYGNVLP